MFNQLCPLRWSAFIGEYSGGKDVALDRQFSGIDPGIECEGGVILMGKSFITLILLIFIPLALAQNGAAPIKKPQSPLLISIEAITSAANGQAADFEVLFSSAVDLTAVQVSVTPSPIVTVHRGELNWQGDLVSGETRRFQFNASVPPGVNAYIQVIVRSAKNFSALAEYQPPSTNTSNAIAASVTGMKTVIRSGRKIIEYPLR